MILSTILPAMTGFILVMIVTQHRIGMFDRMEVGIYETLPVGWQQAAAEASHPSPTTPD